MPGSIRHDQENQLSVAQAFTGAATVSTNAYDKISASQDLSIGRRLALAVYVAVAAGAGSTVQIEAIQADDAALTTNVETIGQSSFLAAQVVPGAELEVPIRKNSMTRRYLGARVTITGGVTTATLNIYIMPMDELVQYKSFQKVVEAKV